MTAKKEKMVTITMPVGEEAGKKVRVTEDQAKRIERDFGEYKPPAKSGAEAVIEGLRSDLTAANDRADAEKAIGTALAGDLGKALQALATAIDDVSPTVSSLSEAGQAIANAPAAQS